jgi:hypothetical protein
VEETDTAGGRFVRRTLSGTITVALFVVSLGLLFAAYAQLALPLVAPRPPLRSPAAVPAPAIAVRPAPPITLRPAPPIALRPAPPIALRPAPPIALRPAPPAHWSQPHAVVAFHGQAHVGAPPRVVQRPARPARAHRRAVAARHDEMPEPPIGFVLRPALALVSDAEPVEPSADMVLVLRPARHRR